MEYASAVWSKVSRISFILMLGLFIASVSLFAQKQDRVKAELFHEVDASMQKAKEQQVPLFAPTLYARSLDYYKRAESDYREGKPIKRIREDLQKSVKTLNEAIQAARVSKVALEEVQQTRLQVGRRDYINLAPKEFAQSERLFQQAILEAEKGDIRAARKKATQAMQGYRKTVIKVLLDGQIKSAENNLEKYKKTLGRDAYNKSRHDLATLKKTVRASQNKSFSISDYIAETEARIGDIIKVVYPDFYKSPPDTLLIGSFTMIVESYEHKGLYNFSSKEIINSSGYARIKFDCGPKIVYPWFPGLILKPYHFIIVDKVNDPSKEIAYKDAVLIEPKAKTGQKLTLQMPEAKGTFIDIHKSIADLITGIKPIKPGGIRVHFENLTIAQTPSKKVGLVKGGQAIYPTVPAVPPIPASISFSGFTLKIDSLHLTPTTSHAKARLQLPNSLAAGSNCQAAEINLGIIDISNHCEFYQELPDSSFGPMEIGNTTLNISGTGYVADFSSTQSYGSSTQPASWKGVLLLNGATNSAPSASVVSNIGYLKASYSFSNALVTSSGLEAHFINSSNYIYTSLQPYGYNVSFNSAKIDVKSSKVMSGSLKNGSLELPETAVHDGTGHPLVASFTMLEVQDDMDLYGELHLTAEIHWGEFTQTTPDHLSYSAGDYQNAVLYFSAKLEEPYFPVSGSNFVQPSLTSLHTDLETQKIQGVTLLDFRNLEIYTHDIPGAPPIKLKIGQVIWPVRCWMNIVTGGVHGTMTMVPRQKVDLKLGPVTSHQYVGKVPFQTVIPPMDQVKEAPPLLMNFVESAVFKSDLRGYIRLEGPSKINLDFKEMLFTSTADNAGGKVDLSTPDTLDYWGLEMVQQQGYTSAGLISVKTGQVILTAAGLQEKRHYQQPFYLTWGEMLATGEMGRLFFDYNTAGQQFDGFNFVPQAVVLSQYDPTPGKWGFLKACGFAHFPFFGPDFLSIHDWKYPAKMGDPYNGRNIEMSFDSKNNCSPTNTHIVGNWSSGFGQLDYNIGYSDTDQNGFVGDGTASLLYIAGGSMSSSLVLKSTGVCISILESNYRHLTLGPVANFGGLARLWGCACLEGDQLKKMVIGADITQTADVNVAVRAGTSLSMLLSVTPSVTQMTMDGEAYLSLAASIDVLANGHFGLKIDRDNSFLEGEISAQFKISAGAALVGNSLEANGEVNWHLGAGITASHYQSLQGMLSLNVLGISSIGAEGGFYMGVNAPKSEAWVLTGVSPKYKLNTSALPATLTGVYGYLKYHQGFNLYVFSGGIEVYAGLGLFTLDAAQVADMNAKSIGLPVSVYLIGNLGGSIHGEILAGLVSASAYFNLQIIGPYPGSFQGTVGLEGCVIWVVCASVDVTVGLNTSDGFYIE